MTYDYHYSGIKICWEIINTLTFYKTIRHGKYKLSALSNAMFQLRWCIFYLETPSSLCITTKGLRVRIFMIFALWILMDKNKRLFFFSSINILFLWITCQQARLAKAQWCMFSFIFSLSNAFSCYLATTCDEKFFFCYFQ